MANPEKMKSSGPLYLAPNLIKEKGIRLLDLVNKNDKLVAFQIYVSEPVAHEFLPNKGLILPGKKIDIEIREVQKGVPVRFKLCALLWPATAPQFDGAVWKQLETKTPVQTINCGQTPAPPPAAKKSSASLESAQIELHPSTISFKPPHGTPQKFVGVFKNVTSRNVAFKVQTNKTKVYSAIPNRGVIQAYDDKKIDFVLDKAATKESIESDKEKDLMCVFALPWPKGLKFDPKEWETLFKDRSKVQKEMIGIDLTGKTAQTHDAQPSKPSSAPASPQQSFIEAKFVDIPEPHTLPFQPPYKDESLTKVMRNMSKDLVAFKANTNKKEFYAVGPAKALMPSGAESELSFEILPDVDVDKLLGDKDKHQFQIVVVKWPNFHMPFDAEEFKRLLVTNKKDVQKIMLTVQFPTEVTSPTKPSKREEAEDEFQEMEPMEEERPSQPEPSPPPPTPKPATPPIAATPRALPVPTISIPVASGPRIVTATPKTLRYTFPNDCKQSWSLQIANTLSKPCAYKLEMDEPLKACFNVAHDQGVIKAGQEVAKIDMSLKAGLQRPPGHAFNVQLRAIAWPMPVFSAALWTELQQLQPADVQTVIVKVEFEIDQQQSNRSVNEKMGSPQSSTRSQSFRDERNKSTPAKKPAAAAAVVVGTSSGFKMEGPRLVVLVPNKLVYRAPYGKVKQTSAVNVLNITDNVVAFKVQTNRRQFYMVNPCRGVLAPNGSCLVDVELAETFTSKDLDPSSPHRFQILALIWPPNVLDFDGDKWTQLQGQNMQTIIFEAQL